MRMVDTNALLSDIESAKAVAYVVEIGDINNLLHKNSVEAEPVKHGRWVKGVDKESELHVAECTACGYQNGLFGYGANYCPNCGARMDAKEE